MGLPDKIKKTLAAASNTSEQTDKSPARKKPTGSARKYARPISEGLPSFKEPQLPEDRRAILVACAHTRRASWAVLRRSGEGAAHHWRFERSLPAVPESASASSPNTRSLRGSASPYNNLTDIPETSIEDIDLAGYACGVCGADGSFGNIFIRCGHCHTLQCQPASTWQCPGCGLTLGEQPMQDMASLSTSGGATPGAGNSLGSPDAAKAIASSKALPTRNGHNRS